MQGELPTDRDFGVYVGKFCFDYTTAGWVGSQAPSLNTTDGVVGTIHVVVEGVGGLPNINGDKLFVLAFDDELNHWKTMRRMWDRSTCDQKKELASFGRPINFNTNEAQVSFDVKVREHLRPRFWYFTFVACNLDAATPLRYTVRATNDMHGWEKEVSLDHMGLFSVYEIFTVAFCIAGLLAAWATRCRERAQNPPLKEHPYIQLLTMAYIASGSSCLLALIHYWMFLGNGFGSLRIRFLAVFAGVVANCTIYLIAILTSSGWAITTSVLPNRRIFLGLITVVGGVHAWCELKAELSTDDSSQLYSYQGSMGVLALIVKMFIFCWFAFQVKSSYDDEMDSQKRRFYKYLGITLGVWAVNIPVVVILAFGTEPWWRYKVVVGVDIGARFLGLSLLSQLLCGPLSPISADNTFSLASHDFAALG